MLDYKKDLVSRENETAQYQVPKNKSPLSKSNVDSSGLKVVLSSIMDLCAIAEMWEIGVRFAS